MEIFTEVLAWIPLAAAAISAAASMGGGIMSAQGASAANAQNAALNWANMNAQGQENQMNRAFQDRVNTQNFASADEANRNQWAFADQQNRIGQAFAREQVATQMDFQERMSSTAYQRAVQDMRAAGINPMLAYIQGGSSSPAGGTATPAAAGGSSQAGSGSGFSSDAGKAVHSMQNTQEEMGRAIGRIGNSAVQAYKDSEGAALIKEQQGLTKQQTATDSMRWSQLEQDTGLKREQKFKTHEEINNVKAVGKLINAQTAKTLNEAVEAGINARQAEKHGGRNTPGTFERIMRSIGDYSSESPIELPTGNRSF